MTRCSRPLQANSVLTRAAVVAIAIALSANALPVRAQPYGADERQAERERYQPLPPQGDAQVRERMRERRGEGGARELSPDQRRELRRDIFEHGREVYRERPGPGGNARQAPRR